MTTSTLRSLLIPCLLSLPLAVGCIAEFHDDNGDGWSDEWDDENPRPSRDGCPTNDTPEPDTCPAPGEALFLSDNAVTCGLISFDCPADHVSFNLDCGCGCIPTDPPEVVCPAEDDPTVLFVSREPKVCTTVMFTCPADQTAFNMACGCGCIAPEMPPQCPDVNDSRVHYLGTDRETCDKIQFTCPDECVSFDDACGCGCIEP